MPSETRDMSAAPVLATYAMTSNGFDTIRLIAAFAVIFSHAFPLTGAAEPLHVLTGLTSVGGVAVSAFFVISGLLIPASLDRGDLQRYTMKRARRIMPALVVAVLLCAFALGPLMTVLPLGEYLTASGTWSFVGNMVFLPVSYDLPGVFADQPHPATNGSLWSLKFEVACYVLVPILFAFASLRKLAVLAAWLASFAIIRIIPEGAGGALFLIDQFFDLFRFFGTGMVFYIFREQIPVRAAWAWIGLALTILAAVFLPVIFMDLAATAGAYAMVAFAYLCPEWFRQLTAKGDISYGVYVYAFPLQQLLVPSAFAIAVDSAIPAWLANSLLTLPPVILAGLLSWLVVEKPALLLGKRRGARPSLATS